MAKVISGKRYAQAAFKLALEKGELDSWQASLRKIADMTTDEKLVSLLENPKLPFEAKKTILAELLGKINLGALNLAYLLVHKDKLGIAGDVSQQYDRLLDTYHGIEHVEVITALPLDDEDRERISSRFGEIIGRKVILDAQVDPSVVGGIKARIGDTLIDGSVRGKLGALRKSLVEISK
ncbi:MAG TPA: ATP synthase F1 subunit delta [Dehalococcoidia bacterium]|nr:ATP synthase F1 subunit delta [Dehalococcoidia bacterium]